MFARMGRWRWVAVGGALALIAGIAVWIAWPSTKKPAYDPPARSRQYIAFTACLLTGPSGVTESEAKAVWSGMQTASTATRAQVTYFPAAVGQAETIGSVTPYANALIQQRCGLIVAVGAVEVAATQSVAATNTTARFVLVGGGTAASNVTVVPSVGVSSVSSRVASVVEDAVGGVFHSGVVS